MNAATARWIPSSVSATAYGAPSPSKPKLVIAGGRDGERDAKKKREQANPRAETGTLATRAVFHWG